MSIVNLAEFRKIAATALDWDVGQYAKQQELEINIRLLGKFLIENFNRFRRAVTQSSIPLSEPYYHVMSQIGHVNGRKLFFEITNRDESVVNIYAEKRGKKSTPPRVEDREFSNRLCHQIVEYLTASNIQRQSKKNSEILTVPKGFYVFEFKTRKEKITCPPVKGKNLDEAITEHNRWPGLWHRCHPHSFRVCTKAGWQKLNSRCRQYPDNNASRYILTLP